MKHYQEKLPDNNLPFTRYINMELKQNEGALGLYQDIRSVQDSLEWNLVCSTFGLPDDEDIDLSWSFTGEHSHYTYSLYQDGSLIVEDMVAEQSIPLKASEFEQTYVTRKSWESINFLRYCSPLI